MSGISPVSRLFLHIFRIPSLNSSAHSLSTAASNLSGPGAAWEGISLIASTMSFLVISMSLIDHSQKYIMEIWTNDLTGHY